MTDHEARVLVVEDEFFLRRTVCQLLKSKGYDVQAAASAEEAAELANEDPPDLVLLDWNLPGLSGLELLKDWRDGGQEFPVIMLTSHAKVDDRVYGLESGADDYLVKPFAHEELLARISARLRRTTPASAQEDALLELGPVTVNLSLHRIETAEGEEDTLTEQEARILEFLSQQAGQPVSRNELLQEVWGYSNPKAIRTRAVDNTIYRLRAKVEVDPQNPRHLLTVHGVGYRLEL